MMTAPLRITRIESQQLRIVESANTVGGRFEIVDEAHSLDFQYFGKRGGADSPIQIRRLRVSRNHGSSNTKAGAADFRFSPVDKLFENSKADKLIA